MIITHATHPQYQRKGVGQKTQPSGCPSLCRNLPAETSTRRKQRHSKFSDPVCNREPPQIKREDHDPTQQRWSHWDVALKLGFPQVIQVLFSECLAQRHWIHSLVPTTGSPHAVHIKLHRYHRSVIKNYMFHNIHATPRPSDAVHDALSQTQIFLNFPTTKLA